MCVCVCAHAVFLSLCCVQEWSSEPSSVTNILQKRDHYVKAVSLSTYISSLFVLLLFFYNPSKFPCKISSICNGNNLKSNRNSQTIKKIVISWRAKPIMTEALTFTFKSPCPIFSLIYSFANPTFPVLCLQCLTKYHSCGNTLKFCNKLELTASQLLSALLLNCQHVMVGLPSSPQNRVSRIHCSLPEHCARFTHSVVQYGKSILHPLKFKYTWSRNITFSKGFLHML